MIKMAFYLLSSTVRAFEEAEGKFYLQQLVWIEGLQSAAGQALNGRMGEIMLFDGRVFQ